MFWFWLKMAWSRGWWEWVFNQEHFTICPEGGDKEKKCIIQHKTTTRHWAVRLHINAWHYKATNVGTDNLSKQKPVWMKSILYGRKTDELKRSRFESLTDRNSSAKRDFMCVQCLRCLKFRTKIFSQRKPLLLHSAESFEIYLMTISRL